ncbi:MAG: DUF1178 family protein [Gammaproteobacteria bacterium]|nr:DUF1178 family protein [Gammaproteobacteria bacterium]
MIIYDLICDSSHEFEGWFKDADDMARQQAQGLLACPYCESLKVSKKLTASKVTRKSNSVGENQQAARGSAPQIGGGQEVLMAGGSVAHYKKVQQMLRKVHDYIDANYENVGNRFAEEAIGIHRGERDPGNIRGIASAEQLEEMAQEGVDAVPLPPRPIDEDKLN